MSSGENITWLFVPGSMPERFDKAVRAGADAVIVDLEDAVGVGQKAASRVHASRWLQESHRAWVRVNAIGTPWFDEDVEALASSSGLAGLVVPKAEDPAALAALGAKIGQPLVALIESALGLHRVHEIAATRGVEVLAFGSLDFSLDIAASPDDDTLMLARSQIVLASRVAGLGAPVDGVTTEVRDMDLVARDARASKARGFGGKLCVHPHQVPVVRECFRVSDEQLAWARDVLKVASGTDGNVAARDGQMIDKPVIDRARAIERAGSTTN